MACVDAKASDPIPTTLWPCSFESAQRKSVSSVTSMPSVKFHGGFSPLGTHDLGRVINKPKKHGKEGCEEEYASACWVNSPGNPAVDAQHEQTESFLFTA